MTKEDSENDLDFLLEKGIDEQFIKNKKHDHITINNCPFSGNRKRKKFHNRQTKRVILNSVDEKNAFNKHLLPNGWVRMLHDSGMYFYCHTLTRVVTWSMPYILELEPPSVHRVPVRSIPCLSYLLMKNDGLDWDTLVKAQKTDLNKKSDNTHSAVSKPGSSIQNITEDNLEEGEIESSDEESEKKKNKAKETLPQNYQISPNKNSNRKRNISFQEDDEKRQTNNILSSSSKKARIVSPTSSKLTNHDNKNKNCDGALPVEKIDYSAKFLEPQIFRNYCDRLFTFVNEFRNIPFKTFIKKKLKSKQNRDDKDDNTKSNSMSEIINEPPDNTDSSQLNTESSNTESKLVPQQCLNNQIKVPNKDIYIDLNGRNYSCILNMYCQHAFGGPPKFNFSNNKTGIHDFEVQCCINGTPYGIGDGKTKKLAKAKSVLKTLEILVPGFSQHLSNQEGSNLSLESYGPNYGFNDSLISTSSSSNNYSNINPSTTTSTSTGADDELFNIFDSMEITDPRILSYCTKLNTMTPKDIFMECMNRHCIPDHKIDSKIEKRDKYNIFKFRIGDKEVEVKCANKREGQQLAAQKMLAQMHPHIQSWGGVMRLYGPGSKPVKRFDMQEMQSLLLEDRGGVKNNLIRLLRKKMLELNDEWEDSKDQSKAKFKVPFENIPVIVFHPDSSNLTNSTINEDSTSSTTNTSSTSKFFN